MISAAVLLPHPPLLLRELGGTQDPVASLRAAAVAAVRSAVAGASAVVVVGGHDEDGDWPADAADDVRRFGTTGVHPSRPGLPTSLAVGRRLLQEAGWDGPVELVAARWHADPGPVAALAERLGDRPDGTVLLVLGDGSARRGEKAPGYLDERAFGFDDAVAAALAGGDAAALRDLDPGEWNFLNTELTVHVLRPPAGEWVCLEAETSLGSGSVGVATSRVYDAHGLVARSAQALLVVRR